MLKRHENNGIKSDIRAVITYTGNDCGEVGPRFTIQNLDNSLTEFPQAQLADFLNDATGLLTNSRTISKEIEQSIFADFKNVLAIDNGQYKYIGPQFIDKHRLFSASYAQAKIDKLINYANSHSTTRAQHGDFNQNEAQVIVQHNIGITNSISNKPIVATFGASNCIILGVYNPNSKEALIAHIDVLTTLYSLNPYLERISKSSGDKLKVFLSGGDNSTKDHAAKLVKIIKQQPQFEISYSDLIYGIFENKLAIDARTGDIFNTFEPQTLFANENYEFNTDSMQSTESPITLSFDGTKQAKTVISEITKFAAEWWAQYLPGVKDASFNKIMQYQTISEKQSKIAIEENTQAHSNTFQDYGIDQNNPSDSGCTTRSLPPEIIKFAAEWWAQYLPGVKDAPFNKIMQYPTISKPDLQLFSLDEDDKNRFLKDAATEEQYNSFIEILIKKISSLQEEDIDCTPWLILDSNGYSPPAALQLPSAMEEAGINVRYNYYLLFPYKTQMNLNEDYVSVAHNIVYVAPWVEFISNSHDLELSNIYGISRNGEKLYKLSKLPDACTDKKFAIGKVSLHFLEVGDYIAEKNGEIKFVAANGDFRFYPCKNLECSQVLEPLVSLYDLPHLPGESSYNHVEDLKIWSL